MLSMLLATVRRDERTGLRKEGQNGVMTLRCKHLEVVAIFLDIPPDYVHILHRVGAASRTSAACLQ